MIDIHQCLKVLAKQRPVFHSEADFQHALAWYLNKQLELEQAGEVKVRLEFPQKFETWIYLDMWLEQPDQIYAIELKYKTCKSDLEHTKEKFHLKNHGAQDLGRYDFLKDVQRLEQVVDRYEQAIGYAVLLTNDTTYWIGDSPNASDASFRLYHDRKVQGELGWGINVGEGTTKGRSKPIMLNSEYLLDWHDYSKIENQKRGEFRYLALEIK